MIASLPLTYDRISILVRILPPTLLDYLNLFLKGRVCGSRNFINILRFRVLGSRVILIVLKLLKVLGRGYFYGLCLQLIIKSLIHYVVNFFSEL